MDRPAQTVLTRIQCRHHITFNVSRVGNFIIGASGSDKQMLCTSSGARAALNIAAEKSKQNRYISYSLKESVFVG